MDSDTTASADAQGAGWRPAPEVETVRVQVARRVADLDERHRGRPVSWAVYRTQWLGGQGRPLYTFSFTRIDSDQWARVTGELSRYDEWLDGDPEDKDEFPVVLRVSAEPDVVEDGFVSIAFWLDELMEWAHALGDAHGTPRTSPGDPA